MANKKLLAVVASVLWVAGCAVEEEGPPPVFNAIDPSLKCPAGQVGWDFTTGGNDTDIVPVATGSEIKIQQVRYSCASASAGDVDLTASFRASCDNQGRCERPIVSSTDSVNFSCAQRSLTVGYKCGNEPTLYNLSRRYVGTAGTLAANAINPVPTNAPTDKVLFTCGDVITMRGASSLLSNGTWSPIYSRLTGCNGLRRCYSNSRTDMDSATYALSPRTRFFYTCGNSTAVRTFEAVYDAAARQNGVPIDFSCSDAVAQTGFEPNATLFVKEVTYVAAAGSTNALTDYTPRLSRSLKSACDGRRSCSLPIPRTDLANASGTFQVSYWCGAGETRTEKKYFHTQDIAGTSAWRGLGAISLQCGGRLNIVSAQQPWVSAECSSGARICSVPPNQPESLINFFCEGTNGAMANTQRIYATGPANTSLMPRSLECPLESERTGIELIRRFSGNSTELPPIADVSACNNRNSCLVRQAGSAQYQYRCSGTNETKTSVSLTVDGQNMNYLDCQPTPRVTEISGCYIAPQSALACQKIPSSGCTVSLTAGAQASTIRACTSNIEIKYRCGSNATVFTRSLSPGSFAASASPDGGTQGPDGGSLFDYTVDCAYDPTPRATPSSKACIPLTCPNNTKRNANMQCEVDGAIAVYRSLSLDVAMKVPDGGQSVTTLKEGFPYIKQVAVTYSGATALSSSQAGMIWAYDVFKKTNGTGPEVRGFRCIVATPAVTSSTVGAGTLGDRTAQDASLIPTHCFYDAPYGDLNSSWYNASRKAGINEQTFRNTYRRLRTVLVPSFDARGRVVASNRNAPNPIGFFYTPATGYIDQYDFFAQQSDFTRTREYTFVPSTRIELQATSGTLDQASLDIGPNSYNNAPLLELNFGWNMLGDTAYSPHSPDTRLSGTYLTSLRYKNLRASLEIAKEDTTIPNKWVANNMAVIGAVELSGGNSQEKVDRLSLPLPGDVIGRILAVRGSGGSRRVDGFMSNNLEINSVFKARVCLDFDGVARAPGAATPDNVFISATVNGTQYSLGITRRCTVEFPFTVVRDIFPSAVLPVNATERGIDRTSARPQGGSLVSSTSNNTSQQGCRTQCSGNSDCGAGGLCERPTSALGYCAQTTGNVPCNSDYRSNSAVGGSTGFGRALFSVESRGTTRTVTGAAPASPGAHNTSTARLLGFNIISSDQDEAGVTLMGSTKKESRISLARTWSSIAAVAEKVAGASMAASASPVRPFWRPRFHRPPSGGPGIALGIQATSPPIFAGPVVLQGEISALIGLGFDIVLKFVTDEQNATNMNMPVYPCLGTSKCVSLSTTAKGFTDANEDCSLQGGRLAEIRTAAEFTAAKTAAAGNPVWIGAQAMHIFDDPLCTVFTLSNGQTLDGGTDGGLLATDGGPPASWWGTAGTDYRYSQCQTNSVSRYSWISGNTTIADSQPTGTLFNVVPANHGFGTLTRIEPVFASPFRSGVLMIPDGGRLEAHRISNRVTSQTRLPAVRTARYLCEFPPATRYVMNEVKLTPSIEFSAGVSAAICFPSTIVGACLAAEFRFFTAALSLENGTRSTKLYNASSNTPLATIGSSGSVASLEWAALSGNAGVEIRYFIGSRNINIISYSGMARGTVPIWEDVTRYRR